MNRVQQPTRKPAAKPAPRPAAAPARSTRVYTVRSGDTLYKIAVAHRIRGGWPALARMNPQIKNPNLIYVGQRLGV